MARPGCSICTCEKAEAVDVSLRLHWTQAEVGSKFGFSASTVGRHARNHLRPVVVSYRDDLLREIGAMQRQVVEESILPELHRLRADLELAHLELAFARPAAGE